MFTLPPLASICCMFGLLSLGQWGSGLCTMLQIWPTNYMDKECHTPHNKPDCSSMLHWDASVMHVIKQHDASSSVPLQHWRMPGRRGSQALLHTCHSNARSSNGQRICGSYEWTTRCHAQHLQPSLRNRIRKCIHAYTDRVMVVPHVNLTACQCGHGCRANRPKTAATPTDQISGGLWFP